MTEEQIAALSVEELRRALRAGEQGLLRRFTRRIDTLEWARPAATGCAAIGALCLVLANVVEFTDDRAKVALMAFGAAAAFIGTVLGGMLDRRKLELGQEATDAYNLADGLLGRLDAAERRLADGSITATQVNLRVKHRFDALRLIREMVEQLISAGAPNETSLQSMLDAASIDIAGVAAFEPGEEWTISIFTLSSDADPPVLSRVGALWADRMSQQTDSRRWHQGEGYTGVAWQRLAEVIEDDTSQPVAGPYPVFDPNLRPYDAGRYRSVISVPVRIGPDQRFWGAVTATSNRAGRFSRNTSSTSVFANEIVRDLAGMTALLAAAEDAQRDGIESSLD